MWAAAGIALVIVAASLAARARTRSTYASQFADRAQGERNLAMTGGYFSDVF
jgi:hypothetical protein